MKDRNELVAEVKKLRDQVHEIEKQIRKIDYDNKFMENNKFVGKCFEIINENNEYIDCFFIYEINKANCELKSIRLQYCLDYPDWFHIEHHRIYIPDIQSDEDNWKEITKETFNKHYFEVMKRIEIIL